jgi:catecholate siderophore receptor
VGEASLAAILTASCSVVAFQSVNTAHAQQPPTSLPQLSVEATAVKKKAPAKAKRRAAAQPQQAAPPPAPTTPPPEATTNPGGVTGYQATRTSTATKTDTPLIDVPQAISVVTREQIEDQSAHSLADVVRYIPGIYIAQGEGHRDAPIIRGQASTADLFLNGIRDDVQYYRDFYNIDRVEVLRGPNAMIFGRGGGGGVINRVSKEAGPTPFNEVSATLGTFGERRATVDVNQPINDKWSVRINGLVEDSETYRDYFERKRYGFNPTITFAPDAQTRYIVSYEFFKDDGTTDRGVPSFGGKPVPTSRSQFFGNPDVSHYGVEAHILRSHLQHWTDAGVKISNQTVFASYDKFYQNVLPGAVTGIGALDTVSLSGYNNHTDRTSIFNQTDISYAFDFGWMKHTVLLGAELSRQTTDNFRETAYFNNLTTSISVPYWSPVDRTPVTFRQSPTDGNTKSTLDVAAIYVQDQIDFGKHFQIIGGVRYDRVSVESLDRRAGTERERTDDLVSPRVGVVFKPFSTLALYASYSVSYLPYSGDQFASLDDTTVTLDPEKFTNYEIGAKWDITPRLSLTAAAYRLNRTNQRMNHPTIPGLVIQTGETETEGFELTLTGQVTNQWQIIAGYGHQDAVVVNAASNVGNRLALVPENTFALWNKYQFTPSFAAGLGIIHQTEVYAGVDNVVTLPDFTRVDAALYFRFADNLRGQLYIENLFDEKYFATAHSNNNIMPASPRAARFTLTSSF